MQNTPNIMFIMYFFSSKFKVSNKLNRLKVLQINSYLLKIKEKQFTKTQDL